MSERAVTIIEAFLGNPFTISVELRDKATALLDQLDTNTTITRLLDKGAGETAIALLLAVGHAQACRHPDPASQVLGKATVRHTLATRLPRPLADYRRIAMAAGRCHAALSRILGSSSAMRAARRDTWAACFGRSLRHTLDLEPVIRDHDVLILGETGTGKEAFARAIQAATPGGPDGAPAPAAAINAAAIPDSLVESELFGHVKGAFTGADDNRVGRLRSADGGAFFLDEVGDLPATAQAKLLRVIETNQVFPVGSDHGYPVDLRYIAATHQDLAAMVDAGEFRHDLFQRLAGNVIYVPPLRDRPDDIMEIGMAFVRSYLGDVGPARQRAVSEWLDSAQARSATWPGNVRELQNALRNLLLGLSPTSDRAAATPPEQPGDPLPASIAGCAATLDTVTDWYLRRVLAHCDGNQSRAAQILGVDRSTVRRRADRRA